MRRLPHAARFVIVPLLVGFVALGLGRWASGQIDVDSRSSLASALDALPASANVAGVTNWSAIRDNLNADDAALRDLTTRSVLAGSIDGMRDVFGWSALDLDWEAYGQTSTRGVLAARLSDSMSTDQVTRGLRAVGYRPRGEVWTLDDQGQAKLGPELAAVLGTVAVVPREKLLVAAAEQGEVRRALATIRHGARSLLDRRPVADLAAELNGADSVLIQAGRTACRASALPADTDVVAQAAAAIRRSGHLATPSFAGRGLSDDGRRQQLSFVAAFDSPATAAQQVRVREALASGPFIGRSGQIEDSLEITSATAHGAVSVLRFDVDPDRGAYMSGEGPLLFAGCP